MNWTGIALIGAGVVGLYLAWPTIQGWLNKKSSADITKQYTDATGATPNLGASLITGTGFGLAEASPEEIAAAQGPAPHVPSYKYPPIRPAPMRKGVLRSRFPKGAGGGNCHFPNPGSVCWNSTCMPFNAKSSDASSVSGRQTLCSRARSKYMAQHVGSKSLSYVGQNIGVA